ncbi:MAG: oligosaccharyl transferase STT3 subunit [archaeon GW2011_AR5]|nr:MAG: oligosaccharyl transferase STT3 subunit [archaeon GW2011_AR5]
MKKLVAILILALVIRSAFFGTYFTGDAIDTAGPARNFAEIGRAAVYSTSETSNGEMTYIDDGLFFNFTHPPMRTLLYSLWASIFGFNAFMIFLPIIFGLLSIVFIYLIGRHLYSEKVGVIAALLAALLRYHFYASSIAFGDNFLMLTTAASVFFFLKYLRGKKNIYLSLFVIMTVLGFLTKLSALAILPALLVIAYLHRDRVKFSKSFLFIVSAGVLSLLAIYFSFPINEALTGVSNDEFNFFDSYVKSFMTARTGYQETGYEKIFYMSSFAWQLTPFFAALMLIALARLKRDKPFYILACWLGITFLIAFLSSGQDFQRLMIIGIAPAIILSAKLVSELWRNDMQYIIFGATVALLLAYLTGLNDMLPYYSPTSVAFFFVLATVFIFVPKNRQLLIGAATGLSIFFLFGTSFLITMNSSATSQLIDAVRERDYPYTELWSDRDISLYLAPSGQASFLRRPELNEKFLRERQVKYLAFYSMYEEEKIINISKLCEDEPFFAIVNSRKVGITCKISQTS